MRLLTVAVPALCWLLSAPAACAAADSEEARTLRAQQLESDYQELYSLTSDKAALEAIRALHTQLDDDNDGAIEPSETGNFISEDLLVHGGDEDRRKRLHLTDAEITVRDLWHEWSRSEVYNWTVDQVVDWLIHNVELKQYADAFRSLEVDGSQLPRLTSTSSPLLAKALGIHNPIHRSKISLKAMDVVLFGPPRDGRNLLKDAILTSLLAAAVAGLFFAYRQNCKHKDQLRTMMSNMDGLSKAEEALKDLQDKLQQKDAQVESLSISASSDALDSIEVERLRQEIESLRSELHRAEVELEDQCWVCPPVLTHWLQLTYEMECARYNAKRKAAEEQLEQARLLCDRVNKNRRSIVGSFISTHGRSIDDVDKSILDAKTALMEVTRDLQERTQRWRQIEILAGVTIVANPGFDALKLLVRHVGRGHDAAAAVSVSGGVPRVASQSRMSRHASHEDVRDHDNDSDAHSVAASSRSTASSHHKRHNLVRAAASRDSSSSEELNRSLGKKTASEVVVNAVKQAKEDAEDQIHFVASHAKIDLPAVAPASPSPSSSSSRASSLAMRKASTSTKVSSATHDNSLNFNKSIDGPPATTSETEVVVKAPAREDAASLNLSREETASLGPTKDETASLGPVKEDTASVGLSMSNSSLSLSRPSMAGDHEDSSDSGSTNDSDAKKKKKRSFFPFRRKKEKKEI